VRYTDPSLMAGHYSKQQCTDIINLTEHGTKYTEQTARSNVWKFMTDP